MHFYTVQHKLTHSPAKQQTIGTHIVYDSIRLNGFERPKVCNILFSRCCSFRCVAFFFFFLTILMQLHIVPLFVLMIHFGYVHQICINGVSNSTLDIRIAYRALYFWFSGEICCCNFFHRRRRRRVYIFIFFFFCVCIWMTGSLVGG